MRKLIMILAIMISTPAIADDYIGSLSSNRFLYSGVGNPFSKWRNPFYGDSPANMFGPYGNRFSAYSWSNPFSVYGPSVYGGPFDNGDPFVYEDVVSGDDYSGYDIPPEEF